MEFLRLYLRQRRGGILLFLFFCGIFALSFALFRLPLEAVAYPALLCLAAALAVSVVDCLRARRKYLRLIRLAAQPAETMTDLPRPDSVEDFCYGAALAHLRAEAADRAERAAADSRAASDYYTLWVHQIKTPITSMRLALQSEDSPLSRRLSSDLTRIEQYVEMVLAFRRLDAPAHDYVFRPCRLDAIVRPAVAKFATEFIDRKIGLRYTPTEATVVTDEKWIGFVVEQLLSNALKYTQTGSVTIDTPGARTLRITDTGIGISQADLPRVFEPGYTGCNGRTDRRASGIGLWLCRRICRALGATIRITSEVGRGTSVTVEFGQYEGRVE